MFMPMASSNKLPAHTISAITASVRRGASALAAKLNAASYTNTHTPENGTPTPNVVAITITTTMSIRALAYSVEWSSCRPLCSDPRIAMAPMQMNSVAATKPSEKLPSAVDPLNAASSLR